VVHGFRIIDLNNPVTSSAFKTSPQKPSTQPYILEQGFPFPMVSHHRRILSVANADVSLDLQVFDFMIMPSAGISKQGLPQACQDPW
jgi:hypothetical protein